MSDDAALNAALAYAALGMAVFPVAPDKTPYTNPRLGLSHGHLDATTDPATIRLWWGNRPKAQIGWAVDSGTLVVDIDSKDARQGYRDFEEREGCAADAVDTPQATTITGGRHLYYAANGRVYKNKVMIDGTGLDTRARGGYVVLPTPGNGREWVKPLTVAKLPAPGWVPTAEPEGERPLREARPFIGSGNPWAAGALASAIEKIENARDGERDVIRHKECYSIGGIIAGGYLDYEPTLAALIDAATRNSTLSEDNLRTRMLRSLKRGMADPRGPPEDEPWPVMTDEEFEKIVREIDPDYVPNEEVPPEIKAAKARLNKIPLPAYTGAKQIIAVRASDIQIRATEYLWEGHLARGGQEIMAGLPGLGKSQVQIHFIACVTAGLVWPDGAKAIQPANVIMLTAEDTLDDTVVPRLIGAKADRERVYIIKTIKTDPRTNRQFLLAGDLNDLERMVGKIGDVALVTIDPITAYMGSKMDSYKATEVRSQLGPLKDFAERTGVAVSTITHPPKAAGPRALDHFIGSQAFIAHARIGHLCIREMVEDEDGKREPSRRLLFTNAKPAPQHVPMPTLAYALGAAVVGQDPKTGVNITSPYVGWVGNVDITADQAVGAANAKPDARGTAQRKVQRFLEQILRDGPVDAKVVENEAAKRHGFSAQQLKTARAHLGIMARQKNEKSGGWEWLFPGDSQGDLPL
jgi:putative DNA primase/helicase